MKHWQLGCGAKTGGVRGVQILLVLAGFRGCKVSLLYPPFFPIYPLFSASVPFCFPSFGVREHCELPAGKGGARPTNGSWRILTGKSLSPGNTIGTFLHKFLGRMPAPPPSKSATSIGTKNNIIHTLFLRRFVNVRNLQNALCSFEIMHAQFANFLNKSVQSCSLRYISQPKNLTSKQL